MSLNLKDTLFESDINKIHASLLKEESKGREIEGNIQTLSRPTLEMVSKFIAQKIDSVKPPIDKIDEKTLLKPLGIIDFNMLKKLSNLSIKNLKISPLQVKGDQIPALNNFDFKKYENMQIVPLFITNKEGENVGGSKSEEEFAAIFYLPAIYSKILPENVSLHREFFGVDEPPEGKALVHTGIKKLHYEMVDPKEVELLQRALASNNKTPLSRIEKLQGRRIPTGSNEKPGESKENNDTSDTQNSMPNLDKEDSNEEKNESIKFLNLEKLHENNLSDILFESNLIGEGILDSIKDLFTGRDKFDSSFTNYTYIKTDDLEGVVDEEVDESLFLDKVAKYVKNKKMLFEIFKFMNDVSDKYKFNVDNINDDDLEKLTGFFNDLTKKIKDDNIEFSEDSFKQDFASMDLSFIIEQDIANVGNIFYRIAEDKETLTNVAQGKYTGLIFEVLNSTADFIKKIDMNASIEKDLGLYAERVAEKFEEKLNSNFETLLRKIRKKYNNNEKVKDLFFVKASFDTVVENKIKKIFKKHSELLTEKIKENIKRIDKLSIDKAVKKVDLSRLYNTLNIDLTEFNVLDFYKGLFNLENPDIDLEINSIVEDNLRLFNFCKFIGENLNIQFILTQLDTIIISRGEDGPELGDDSASDIEDAPAHESEHDPEVEDDDDGSATAKILSTDEGSLYINGDNVFDNLENLIDSCPVDSYYEIIPEIDGIIIDQLDIPYFIKSNNEKYTLHFKDGRLFKNENLKDLVNYIINIEICKSFSEINKNVGDEIKIKFQTNEIEKSVIENILKSHSESSNSGQTQGALFIQHDMIKNFLDDENFQVEPQDKQALETVYKITYKTRDFNHQDELTSISYDKAFSQEIEIPNHESVDVIEKFTDNFVDDSVLETINKILIEYTESIFKVTALKKYAELLQAAVKGASVWSGTSTVAGVLDTFEKRYPIFGKLLTSYFKEMGINSDTKPQDCLGKIKTFIIKTNNVNKEYRKVIEKIVNNKTLMTALKNKKISAGNIKSNIIGRIGKRYQNYIKPDVVSNVIRLLKNSDNVTIKKLFDKRLNIFGESFIYKSGIKNFLLEEADSVLDIKVDINDLFYSIYNELYDTEENIFDEVISKLNKIRLSLYKKNLRMSQSRFEDIFPKYSGGDLEHADYKIDICKVLSYEICMAILENKDEIKGLKIVGELKKLDDIKLGKSNVLYSEKTYNRLKLEMKKTGNDKKFSELSRDELNEKLDESVKHVLLDIAIAQHMKYDEELKEAVKPKLEKWRNSDVMSQKEHDRIKGEMTRTKAGIRGGTQGAVSGALIATGVVLTITTGPVGLAAGAFVGGAIGGAIGGYNLGKLRGKNKDEETFTSKKDIWANEKEVKDSAEKLFEVITSLAADIKDIYLESKNSYINGNLINLLFENKLNESDEKELTRESLTRILKSNNILSFGFPDVANSRKAESSLVESIAGVLEDIFDIKIKGINKGSKTLQNERLSAEVDTETKVGQPASSTLAQTFGGAGAPPNMNANINPEQFMNMMNMSGGPMMFLFMQMMMQNNQFQQDISKLFGKMDQEKITCKEAATAVEEASGGEISDLDKALSDAIKFYRRGLPTLNIDQAKKIVLTIKENKKKINDALQIYHSVTESENKTFYIDFKGVDILDLLNMNFNIKKGEENLDITRIDKDDIHEGFFIIKKTNHQGLIDKEDVPNNDTLQSLINKSKKMTLFLLYAILSEDKGFDVFIEKYKQIFNINTIIDEDKGENIRDFVKVFFDIKIVVEEGVKNLFIGSLSKMLFETNNFRKNKVKSTIPDKVNSDLSYLRNEMKRIWKL